MPKRSPSLLFILSLVLIFSGCATLKTSTVDHSAKHTFPTSQEMLEKIDRTHQGPVTLKAIAHIEVNTDKGRYPLKAAVMIKRPSSLRLEVLPLIGPPELILSVHGNVLKAFLPQRGEFYTGQASEKNLGHFFPFSTAGLVTEDIVSILFGTRPMTKNKSLVLRGSPDEDFYRLDILIEKSKIQSLFINSENNSLVRVDLFDTDSSRRYSVRFFGQRIVENIPIPNKITLISGDDEKQFMIIRYSDTQVEEGVDAVSFDLQPPLNVKTISMD